MTATNTLTTGISVSRDYSNGIELFVKKSCIDTEALKIRCSITSYTAGNMIDLPEHIFFTDKGKGYRLSISRNGQSIQNCKNVILNGAVQSLTADGIHGFDKMWKELELSGNTPLAFTFASSDSNYTDECLLGIIVFKEGIDTELSKNILHLERLGCKVISFARRGNIPKIPPEITQK